MFGRFQGVDDDDDGRIGVVAFVFGHPFLLLSKSLFGISIQFSFCSALMRPSSSKSSFSSSLQKKVVVLSRRAYARRCCCCSSSLVKRAQYRDCETRSIVSTVLSVRVSTSISSSFPKEEEEEEEAYAFVVKKREQERERERLSLEREREREREREECFAQSAYYVVRVVKGYYQAVSSV